MLACSDLNLAVDPSGGKTPAEILLRTS